MDLDVDPETLISTLLEVVLSDPDQLDEAVPQVCELAADERIGARRGVVRFLEASCVAEPSHWPGACAALATLLSDVDEITARRACVAAGTFVRGAFAHVVTQPLSSVAGLRQQWSSILALRDAVGAVAATGGRPLGSTTSHRPGVSAAALHSLGAIALMILQSAPVGLGPDGRPKSCAWQTVKTLGGGHHPVLDRTSLTTFAEGTLDKLLRWTTHFFGVPASDADAAESLTSSSSAAKSSTSSSLGSGLSSAPSRVGVRRWGVAEYSAALSALQSLALSSPPHFPRIARGFKVMLRRTCSLEAAQGSTSEQEGRSRQLPLVIALHHLAFGDLSAITTTAAAANQAAAEATDGGNRLAAKASDGSEQQADLERQLEVEQKQQVQALSSVRHCARNHALLLVRSGRGGVAALRLNPVQEQERFKATDEIAETLSALCGMSVQVKKVLPEHAHARLDTQLLIGQVEKATPAAGKEKAGEEASADKSTDKSSRATLDPPRTLTPPLPVVAPLDPRRTSRDPRVHRRAAAAAAAAASSSSSKEGAGGASAVAAVTGGGPALTAAKALALGHQARARMLASCSSSLSSSSLATARGVASGASGGGGGAPDLVSIQLGRESALGEALLVRLGCLDEEARGRLPPPPPQLTQATTTMAAATAGGGGDNEEKDGAWSVVEHCLGDLGSRLHMLLALLYELFVRDPSSGGHPTNLLHFDLLFKDGAKISNLSTAAARAGAAGGAAGAGVPGTSTQSLAYDLVLEHVVVGRCLENTTRQGFKRLQRLLLECPAVPPSLPVAVMDKCLQASTSVAAALSSSSSSSSDQLLKAGLSVLRVLALERSGPVETRLVSLDCALHLACAAGVDPALLEFASAENASKSHSGASSGEKMAAGEDDEGGEEYEAAAAASSSSSSSFVSAQRISLSSSLRSKGVGLVVQHLWGSQELEPLVERRALDLVERAADAVEDEVVRKTSARTRLAQEHTLRQKEKERERAAVQLEKQQFQQTQTKNLKRMTGAMHDDGDEGEEEEEEDEPLFDPSDLVGAEEEDEPLPEELAAADDDAAATGNSLSAGGESGGAEEEKGARKRLISDFPPSTREAAITLAFERRRAKELAAAAATAALPPPGAPPPGPPPAGPPPPGPPPAGPPPQGAPLTLAPPPGVSLAPPPGMSLVRSLPATSAEFSPSKRAKASSSSWAAAAKATTAAPSTDDHAHAAGGSQGTKGTGTSEPSSSSSSSDERGGGGGGALLVAALDSPLAVRCLLELPTALAGKSKPIFTRMLSLYASAALPAATAAAALDAAAVAARRAATAQQLEKQQQQQLEAAAVDASAGGEQLSVGALAEVEASALAAVRAAQSVVPRGPGLVVHAIDSSAKQVTKFAAESFGKVEVVRLLASAPHASSPLVFRVLESLASSETLSSSLPLALDLLNAAAQLEHQRRSPDIRHVIPFLGACDANRLANHVLPRILPWPSADLAEAKANGSLERILLACRTPGPPLTSVEFERALRYRVNAAGKANSEQATAAAAELVELLVRVSSSLLTQAQKSAAQAQLQLQQQQQQQAHQPLEQHLAATVSAARAVQRSAFAAFEVVCCSDAVSVVALQRALLNAAASPNHHHHHPSSDAAAAASAVPLLLLRFLMECVKRRPNLAQFVCTQVMPALVMSQIWGEKERWVGFGLLAKNFFGVKKGEVLSPGQLPRPPHCLACLAQMPSKPLQQLLAVYPHAQQALDAFVQSGGGGGMGSHFPPPQVTGALHHNHGGPLQNPPQQHQGLFRQMQQQPTSHYGPGGSGY